jgi:hypothetical protein
MSKIKKGCFKWRPKEANIFMYFPWPLLEAEQLISMFVSYLHVAYNPLNCEK